MVPHQEPNFTIEQIKSAHAKVKSGADFPSYIHEIKTLGVVAYEHFVADGHVNYYGQQDYTILGDAKWQMRTINKLSNDAQLQSTLKAHQAGETDYPAFCKQAAQLGVEKWIVNLDEMTCIYYNLNGKKMLIERINIL